MERRIGARAQVDFPVIAFVDGFGHPCRAIDLSTTGMVVERTKRLSERALPSLRAIELRLGDRRIRARARSVWSDGRLEAVRFLVMSDVDRLAIAEHLDRKARLREPLH